MKSIDPVTHQKSWLRCFYLNILAQSAEKPAAELIYILSFSLLLYRVTYQRKKVVPHFFE